MNVHVSHNLREVFPDLQRILKDIAKCAKSLDRDVRIRDLYVEARCCNDSRDYSGTAHPQIYTLDRRWKREQFYFHPPGKITMSIGTKVDVLDIALLFGHELRHIAQFHRGYKKYGCLCIDPLSGGQSEIDAYEFEERVVEVL